MNDTNTHAFYPCHDMVPIPLFPYDISHWKYVVDEKFAYSGMYMIGKNAKYFYSTPKKENNMKSTEKIHICWCIWYECILHIHNNFLIAHNKLILKLILVTPLFIKVTNSRKFQNFHTQKKKVLFCAYRIIYCQFDLI